jgi:DNA (cytosine-5)-methyltransferase 1
VTIPNHYSAALSEMDLEIARAVPPGGNWKNLPDSIDSDRIRKIRVDFKAGKGSRSTYYGRLRPDRPSYTINTYFSRPGNGCHLHYDFTGGQHRVLSEREAARLQSFPDSFVFRGSHRSVHQQIGNAVPPLLGYQIARCLTVKGQFVDLFSGAGGLALGFLWAGWTPIVSSDIEASFLETHHSNLDTPVVLGDIREEPVVAAIVAEVRAARAKKPGLPVLVLGGPPCQGFSTAGNYRSMDDERNHLFHDYRQLVDRIAPDGFLFENVTGLLNMQGGAVFDMIRETLNGPGFSLRWQVLDAEEYAIPQRRRRVVLMGVGPGLRGWSFPTPTTAPTRSGGLESLPLPVSVEEALSDLPPLTPGQDGSGLDYVTEPRNSYQSFMRGLRDAEEYLKATSERPSLAGANQTPMAF